MSRPKGKVLLGFNAPEEMAQTFNEIVKKKGGTVTTVLTEAVSQYIERELNPDLIDDQILEALEKKPDLLEKHVKIIIENMMARQLSK